MIFLKISDIIYTESERKKCTLKNIYILSTQCKLLCDAIAESLKCKPAGTNQGYLRILGCYNMATYYEKSGCSTVKRKGVLNYIAIKGSCGMVDAIESSVNSRAESKLGFSWLLYQTLEMPINPSAVN